jgi:serine/threonine-protein kinase RIO1
MSQATTLDNPNAKAYLERDVRNVCNFFRKLKVRVDDGAILKEITAKG